MSAEAQVSSFNSQGMGAVSARQIRWRGSQCIYAPGKDPDDCRPFFRRSRFLGHCVPCCFLFLWMDGGYSLPDGSCGLAQQILRNLLADGSWRIETMLSWRFMPMVPLREPNDAPVAPAFALLSLCMSDPEPCATSSR